MLALVKYGTGANETELREVPTPEIGEDDLLIEVKAAGICGSDIAYDNGEHPEHLNCPVVLGHEFAGVVAKIGNHVKKWKVGDRVVSDNTGYVCGACNACATGQFLMCPHRLGLGYGMDGGFTDHVKISGVLLERNPMSLFAIPEHISFAEAAILDPMCNAYKAVVQESGILPGEDIVIYGVGPIGLFAIQVAKLLGCANIVAIGRDGNEKRFDMAKQYGATHIIRSNREHVKERISEITEGELVPVVIDAAGPNEVIRQGMEIVRTGGIVVKMGYDKESYTHSLDPIVNRGIRIVGHFGYDYTSWKNVIRLLKLGKIDLKGMISHYIELKDWEQAFELIRNKQAIKIIVGTEEEKSNGI